MLNKIEKKFIFPFVRIAGLLSAFIILIIIIGGFLLLFTFESNQLKKTHVSFEEISQVINPQQDKQLDSKQKSSLYYSDSINKYLSGDNSGILDGWLEEYETKKEKQDFLDNLSGIIIQAEENKVDVYSYINNYKVLKIENLEEDTFGLKKYINPIVEVVLLFFISITFLLFIVVIVLLLLLSIERNTRKEN